MKKRLFSLLLATTMLMTMSLVACSEKDDSKGTTKKQEVKNTTVGNTTASQNNNDNQGTPENPGESGFLEFEIGDAQKVGPFMIAAVYFQGVDMVPEGKQPAASESDLHLEADIHLTNEASQKYGFGKQESEDDAHWPAYMNVKYQVLDSEGREVASGNMMPMNADDGPHYGVNIKKNVLKVGKYKLKIEFKVTDDYLLHVDEETGVPVAKEPNGKELAKDYFKTYTAEFDWNYDAKQLQNR